MSLENSTVSLMYCYIHIYPNAVSHAYWRSLYETNSRISHPLPSQRRDTRLTIFQPWTRPLSAPRLSAEQLTKCRYTMSNTSHVEIRLGCRRNQRSAHLSNKHCRPKIRGNYSASPFRRRFMPIEGWARRARNVPGSI